jgi:regulatory protein
MTSFSYKRKKKTQEPESFEKAYDYAVFLLSLHLRTVGEVLKKMQDRGFTEQAIGQVLEQLKAQRYLDDQRYAEIFLENLKTYRNFGYYGIKKKMMEKKLPMNLIESVLEEGLSKEEEAKIAKRLLKKEGFAVKSPATAEQDNDLHYQTFSDGQQNKEKAKMSQRLKSRGFRSDVIAKLIF